MPFTGQLGTPDSYLGNIELGLSPSAFIFSLLGDSFVIADLNHHSKTINLRLTPGHLQPRVVPPATPHHSVAILVNKPPTPAPLVPSPLPVQPTALRSLQATYAMRFARRR